MAFQVSTHESLLARLKTPDSEDAWREFHARYYDLVRNFARRGGLQPSDADDLAQEVLLVLQQNLRGFEYDSHRGRFRGYLKTITLRALWKRTTPSPALGDEDELKQLDTDPDMDARFESEWRQYHLRLALQTARHEFTPDDMHIFELTALDGCSAADAAGVTGLSVERIYRVKSAVLARIRQLVSRQVEEEG